MKKTAQELIDLSDDTFTTNGQGEITAANHREFNVSLIQSVALETYWQNVTDDLSSTTPGRNGGVVIRRCLLKRTGDVILMVIEGSVAIINTSFTGQTFMLDTSIFNLSDMPRQIGTFASESGNVFTLNCGTLESLNPVGNIIFKFINPSVTAKDDFALHIAYPFKEPD